MKKIAKICMILFTVFVLLAVIPAGVGAYGLFWQRYVTSLMGNPTAPRFSWYKPLESVAPAQNFSAFSTAVTHSFSEKSINDVINYAADHGSDSLTVLHQGEIVVESYWNGTAADSLFPTHSLMKTLPAILIGHAIAEGYIESVDVPVSTFITEWNEPQRSAITIRHLLTMTSGIAESYDFRPSSARIKRTMGTDIVTANIEVGIAGPPGKVFAHFNPNPQLLGVILERATGQRFGDYLASRLWQPLGLHEAFLFVDQAGGMAHTDCCMWAQIRDWVHIGELLRNKGRVDSQQLIPKGWVAQMLQATAAYPNYGMMVWLGNSYEEWRRYDPDRQTFANFHSEPYAVDDVFFLDGLGKIRLYVVPSQGLVILRTGPSSSDWDDSYLVNRLIRGLAQ